MKSIKFYGFPILISFIFLGASCSSIETNKIAPGFKVAFDSIKKAVFGFPENTFITREIVENIPYASLTLKIGKGPRGLLILESVNDNETLWVSRDNVYIRLENGRITRTFGLVNNIVTYLSPKVLFLRRIKRSRFTTMSPKSKILFLFYFCEDLCESPSKKFSLLK